MHLNLRVRAGARVAARLTIGPATAEEVLQASQQKHAARLAAKQVASGATAVAAADGVAAGGARADAAEMRGDAGEVAEIVIEIEALELTAEQKLPCRTVELAVDVLGLLRPAPRTRAVSVRGQRGVPVRL